MFIFIIALIIIFSFTIVIYIKKHKKHGKYKKVKPLSKMSKEEFRQAMKELEIK